MTSDTDNDGPSRSQSPDDGGEQDYDTDSGEQPTMAEHSDDVTKNGQQKKPISNAKDPSRPRRKKARRACFACQRAHLTCGDERPCQRCIKRGLHEGCQDGMRKKAKYLHDAPPEALLPGGASHYQYINNLRRQPQPQSPTYPLTPVTDVYNQRTPTTSYPVYSQTQATQIPLSENVINAATFGTQQSPISTQFPTNTAQSSSSIPTVVQNMPQPATQDAPSGLSGYDPNMVDTNDLNQYDFDLRAFDFGNHYGALEFGMLGQMSSGAAETPPGDNGSQMTQNGPTAFATPGTLSTNYSGSPVSTQPYMFGPDQQVTDWRPPTQMQSNMRSASDGVVVNRGDISSHGIVKQEHPSAFSIGANSAFATPTSGLSPQQHKASFDGTPPQKTTGSSGSAPSSRPGTQGGPPNQSQKMQAPAPQQPPKGSRNIFANASFASHKRRGDPSSIYENVSHAYPYTRGFHNLISLVTSRFSMEDRIKIAKALASIRPAFITCTNTLTHQDLIFMEQCFQRSLWEYEDFISACGTPTLVCRRTGEVAAVGKEFSILTGWRKDVLLGNEANLNVNIGNRSALSSGIVSSRGLNAPRVPEGAIESSLPQPAFIAELLDDQSAVEFYQDFARLAFEDSHGVVTTTYKLLKYRTKDDQARIDSAEASDPMMSKRKRGRILGKSMDAGIDELGDEEGKVECCCCWTVKRDLFDLPMMIVMNFLPCI